MDVLVLNSGSSSIKYILYSWDKKITIAKGIVERVTMERSSISHDVVGKETLIINRDCPTHREAVDLIMEILTDSNHAAAPLI